MRQEFVRDHYARVLMELCGRRPLGDIRAAEVIAASGMSRPTFYRYFANLYELVNFTASRSFLDTETPLFSGQNIKASYEFALNHRPFFLQLPAQRGDGSFKEASKRWLRKKGYDLYAGRTLAQSERLRRMVQFDMFLGGSLDVMETWLGSRMALPVDDVVGAVLSMMPPFMTGAGRSGSAPIEPDDFPR